MYGAGAVTSQVSLHPVIATNGLSKDYGSGRGVFELDLEVEQGEVFGFLGPNGPASPRPCACCWA